MPALLSLLQIFLLPSVSLSISAISPYSLPAPWADPSNLCHAPSGASSVSLCDASSLLSSSSFDDLSLLLSSIHSASSPYPAVVCAPHPSAGFHVVVVIVRRMAPDGRSLSDRVAHFAHVLFLHWDLAAHCGASVLLLLSWTDRILYVQTGDLAAHYVQKSDVDDISAAMLPELEKGRIADALTKGVLQIGVRLRKYRGESVQSGEELPPRGRGDHHEEGQKNVSNRGMAAFFEFMGALFLLILCAFALPCLLCALCCPPEEDHDAELQSEEYKCVMDELKPIRDAYVQAAYPQEGAETEQSGQARQTEEETTPLLQEGRDSSAWREMWLKLADTGRRFPGVLTEDVKEKLADIRSRFLGSEHVEKWELAYLMERRDGEEEEEEEEEGPEIEISVEREKEEEDKGSPETGFAVTWGRDTDENTGGHAVRWGTEQGEGGGRGAAWGDGDGGGAGTGWGEGEGGGGGAGWGDGDGGGGGAGWGDGQVGESGNNAMDD